MFSTNHEFTLVCTCIHIVVDNIHKEDLLSDDTVSVFDYGWVITYLDSFFMYYRIQHEYISFISSASGYIKFSQ